MIKRKLLLFLTALIFLILLMPQVSRAQMNIGQYEDEAPLVSWNHYGLATGISLGTGGILYAFSRDCSSSLANPALLSHLPRFTFTLNSHYSSSSLFKYAIVNTGVVLTEQKPLISVYSLNFGGFSVMVRGWAFSFSRAMTEVYGRPSVEHKYYYRGTPAYTLNFDQEGHLIITHFALARKMGRRISVGIGLNFVRGNLTKNIKEEFPGSNITITDDKAYEFKGQYINAGLWVRVWKELELAAVVRAPFTKKAESDSSYRYLCPDGDTDIRIDASAENSYQQPLVIGLGLSYWFSARLRVASDFSFFNWSTYKVTYFEEELNRDFKDILKISAGFEYLSPLRLFGSELIVPFRGGFTYDPQPMKEPGSSYYYYSIGTGLRLGNSSLDVGASFGHESGSGDSLSAKRIAMSWTLKL